MGKQNRPRHLKGDVARTSTVFYYPEHKLFWAGPKSAPQPLRKAHVFQYNEPDQPPGTVVMTYMRARKLSDLGAHKRYEEFVQKRPFE
jgi:hypothetical protein